MSPTPGTWSPEDIRDLFELDEQHERDGMETVVAYLGELADRGVTVEVVERETDAESGLMIAAELHLTGDRVVRAHFPAVPLGWLRERADFAEQWRDWCRYEIGEMFVQGEGYVDWTEAVEAGARAL
ncbi:hypothetical protein [Streptomyces sp. MMG1121]|uniref:hypothetical protein n=1 Tax=Streptomyces sp. MMG1121 TaxID=1415544 RepID=UPI0006AE7B3D|nr:hypothetical protein [Streptomyces sp. MMG1121]KOV60596.1 hypothetical protein ADK64_31160 [Streptomyces sp. MMG1121]